MRDYEELVERLKTCAELHGECSLCIYQGNPCDCMPETPLEDAADAIEELCKDLERSKEWEKFRENEANEALKKFQIAVADKPKWISVEEPPTKNVCDDGYTGYLVFSDGYIKVADYTCGFYVEGEYDPNVTHYMPLPNPPKETTDG